MSQDSGRRPRRVAVVGTGILGASAGWNLARRGASVVFVDAGRPGAGVTDWTFSWVNASNKTVTKAYFDLNVAGIAAHRRLAETIGAGAWWYPGGHLRWADDPAAEAEQLETAKLLADWGYPVEVCSGAETRRRFEPALRMPDGAAVLFYADEAWVHGRNLVGRLVGEAVAAGAESRFGTAVREIGTGADGAVETVALADGSRIAVDAVVNAAGPAAATVAALVGRDLPMRHEPGAVARLSCARPPIRRPIHAPRIEIRPDGPGSLVLHSREIDALIDGGAPDLGERLHALARDVAPEFDAARITGTRVSNRPIPADGFPSVGAVPTVPGYYEAVSHSGITLGPVLGRLLAAEIVDGTRDPLLADYRPERF